MEHINYAQAKLQFAPLKLLAPTVEASSKCPRCHAFKSLSRIPSTGDTWTIRLPFHVRSDGLVWFEELECGLCALLQLYVETDAMIMDFIDTPGQLEVDLQMTFVVDDTTGKSELSCTGTDVKSGKQMAGPFTIPVFADVSRNVPFWDCNRGPLRYANNKATMETFKQLYQKHRKPSPPSLARPRRILEITGLEKTGCIRLKETNDCLATDGPDFTYVTLSYSWGNTPEAFNSQLKTVPSNLHAHFTGIPLSKLPGSIQDAVIVCHHVGVQYLWVDALCIIQGSRQDWISEGLKMADIFEGAQFAICAVASSGCHEGFLDRTRFRNTLPTCVKVPIHDVKKRLDADDYLVVLPEHIWRHNMIESAETSSWLSRGWVHQEYYLSASKMQFFQCSGAFNIGSQQTIIEAGYPRSAEIKPGQDLSVEQEWYYRLSDYTRKKLTYESDRMTAYSALALRYAQAMGYSEGDYLAGLWKPTFTTDLQWTTTGAEETLEQLIGMLDGQYGKSGTDLVVIPSWSFFRDSRNLGRGSRYVRGRGDDDPVIRLLWQDLHVSVTSPAGERFSTCSKATLKCSAQLYPIQIGNQRPRELIGGGREYIVLDTFHVYISLDWKLAEEDKSITFYLLGIARNNDSVTAPVNIPTDQRHMVKPVDQGPGIVHYDVTLKGQRFDGMSSEGGLVLYKKGPGVFYRVGHFSSILYGVLSTKCGKWYLFEGLEHESIEIL